MRFLSTTPLLAAVAFLAAMALPPAPAQAQFFGRGPAAVQLGATGEPGVGVQAGYVQPRTVFTVEATLYADVQAPFSEAGERRFQAAGSVGGALRAFEIVRIVTGGGPSGHLDLGLRAGPGLGFEAEETVAEKNRRFRLLLDPFTRYVRRVGGVRAFGEVGLARPRLRAGVWLGL
jgi:hypothetical protein